MKKLSFGKKAFRVFISITLIALLIPLGGVKTGSAYAADASDNANVSSQTKDKSDAQDMSKKTTDKEKATENAVDSNLAKDADAQASANQNPTSVPGGAIEPTFTENCGSQSYNGETVTVSGRITDKTSGTGLSAKIYATTSTYIPLSTTTDAEGYYILSNVPKNVNLTFSVDVLKSGTTTIDSLYDKVYNPKFIASGDLPNYNFQLEKHATSRLVCKSSDPNPHEYMGNYSFVNDGEAWGGTSAFSWYEFDIWQGSKFYVTGDYCLYWANLDGEFGIPSTSYFEPHGKSGYVVDYWTINGSRLEVGQTYTVGQENLDIQCHYTTGSISKPAKPQNVRVTAKTDTSITLAWDEVAKNTFYHTQIRKSDGTYQGFGLTNAKTYTFTNLNPDTTYTFLIQSDNHYCASDFSVSDHVVATTTGGYRPVITPTQTGDGEVTISWTAIPNAEKYVAYEVIGGKFVQIGEELASSTLSVKKDNLANGYEHTFLVQAMVGGKWSNFDQGDYKSITPEGTVKPTISTAEVAGTNIKLTWNKVPGASRYAIATKVGASGYTTYTMDCTDLTYTITGLEEGVTYDCLVQANINGKWSEFKDTDLKQATTKGIRPVLTAEATGDGEVTLTWDEIENADKYAAYEVIGNSFRAIDENIPSTQTSIVAYDLANNYEHTFLVQAHVDGVWSKFSSNNYRSATPTGTVKPAISTAEVTGTNIKLTWNKVPGASRYAIATKVGASGYATYTMDCTDLTYTITGLEDGVTYDCLVQANINGKWSEFTDTDLKQATTKGIRPLITAEATGDGEVTLSWAAIENADKYAAYEVIGNSFKAIDENIPSTQTSIVAEDLANDYEHTFLVQAHVAGVWSKFSENNYRSATPTGTVKPELNTPTVEGTSISLSWFAVPGASAYAVATKVGTSGYTTYTMSCTNTGYVISGLEEGVTYDCLVQANINGKWSEFTDTDLKQATTKGTRPAPTATPDGDGKVKLEWEEIEGATLYAAYEVVNGNFVSINEEIPSTQCDIVAEDLGNGYKHTFLVQAYVGGQWSKFSDKNYVSAIPEGTMKPTLETPSVSGANITLTWNSVPGATEYAVATKVGTSSFTTHAITQKDVTTYTIQGMERGLTYDCLVQAKVCGNWSQFDATDYKQAAVKGDKPAPVATEVGNGKVKLTWEAIDGADFYAVYQVKYYAGKANYSALDDSVFDTEYIADDCSPDATTTFLVQSNSQGTWSSFTEKNYVSIKLSGDAKPTNITIEPLNGGNTYFTWDQVPGYHTYSVAYKNADGSYTTIADKIDSIYMFYGLLQPNTDYSFVVQSYNHDTQKYSPFTDEDLVTIRTAAYNPNAVMVYNSGASTIKYYCDGNDHSAEGTVLALDDANNNETIYNYRNAASTVTFDQSFASYKPKNIKCWFGGATISGANVSSINGMQYFDTSEALIADDLFAGCKKLTSLDLSTLDTSNVRSMVNMFNACENLTSLNLNNFDTSSCTDFTQMFCNCKKLQHIDVSDFDTSSAVKMWNMFCGCDELQSLDLSNFDVSNVTDTRLMFQSCKNITSINMSSWDTSNLTDMTYMFMGCQAIKNIDLSMFDTSKVTHFDGLFFACNALETVNLSSFNTTKAEKMDGMFYSCYNLQTLDLSSFDTRHCTHQTQMFAECHSLKTIYTTTNYDPKFDYSPIYYTQMFDNCIKLVGGKGTTFSSEHRSKEYARIDGGPSSATPGYFTEKA